MRTRHLFFCLFLRGIMVPRLQWLLLLWGLQGLWAQDYEEDKEDGRVNTRRKKRQLPSNFIPRNGKCKSKFLSLFGGDCLPLLPFTRGNVQVGHVSLFITCCHRWKYRTWYSTRTRMQPTWVIPLGFLQAIHPPCDRSALCYPNVLFAPNLVSRSTFPLWQINAIYPQPILDQRPPSIAEGWCSK